MLWWTQALLTNFLDQVDVHVRQLWVDPQNYFAIPRPLLTTVVKNAGGLPLCLELNGNTLKALYNQVAPQCDI